MQGKFRDIVSDSDYLILENLISQDHFLIRVNQHIDFSFINVLTESCYSPNNGRPSISPETYFRMMLIGYLFAIRSNRRLVEEVRYNISYRWFCGIPLDSPVPHHSSLSRLKKRVSVNQFQAFFDEIVKQCRQVGLLASKSIMTDSTLFQANTSLNSMVLKSGIDDTSEEGERGIKPPKRTISNKTHQSNTDPDASLAFKAGTPHTLKYKAHVCSDSQSRVILDIKITTGAVHDSQPYLEQITSLKSRLQHDIIEAIADRGYGSGYIISSLQSAKITAYIPLFSTRSGGSQRTVTPGFRYDLERNIYHCPANHELKPGKTLENDYVLYHSSVKNCRDCPIQAACEAPKKQNRDIRVISRHVHFELFQQVKLNMETKLFKQKLTERLSRIESIMNELKNYHGLSKARYRGIDNVQIQAYMAAIAINIKRIVFSLLFCRYLIILLKMKSPFSTGRTFYLFKLLFCSDLIFNYIQ